jgi:Mg/Co/Ni transporter MgtE
MPRSSNARRALTIAEVADYLGREADATIQRAEGLRRELDERLAAFEKTLRDIQWLLNHPAYGSAK